MAGYRQMVIKEFKLEEKIFKCRRCGHCCHGETTVSLDGHDLERMITYLHLPPEQAQKRYLRDTNGVIQMKVVDGHCIFYRDGCTVHPGRPWRCRQWPLHPSILVDPANLSAIRESCPGIDKDLDYDEFCQVLSELLVSEKKGDEG